MSILVAVSVGRPRLKQWRGRTVSTSIFKRPIAGRVAVRTENLEGDQQSDRSVHGGPDKAVYAYPVEHYEAWQADLAEVDLPPGSFGENLTVSGGWLEDRVRIGDRFRIGSARFEVSQPRLPCLKLNLRFQRPDMVRLMLATGRFGFYLRVLAEGDIGAGDAIGREAEAPHDFSVAEAARLAVIDRDDLALLRRGVGVEALPGPWLEDFRDRLARLEGRETVGPA